MNRSNTRHTQTHAHKTHKARTTRTQPQVDPSALVPLTFASHSYDTFHLLMPLYECRAWAGTPTGAEGQQLTWVAGPELEAFEMPAADVPLIEPVRAALSR